MPVQEVQQRTTSREFIRWQVYLDDEPNTFNPLYYYLAAIRSDIYKANCATKAEQKKHTIESKLLKFVKKERGRIAPVSAAAGNERMLASKKNWFTAFGLGADGKPKEEKVPQRPVVMPNKRKRNNAHAKVKPADTNPRSSS